MQYLHDASFDSTLQTMRETGEAYSNVILNGQEYYYVLYQMENSEWTLLFLVPSAYVATNTVQLVNTTTRLLLLITDEKSFIENAQAAFKKQKLPCCLQNPRRRRTNYCGRIRWTLFYWAVVSRTIRLPEICTGCGTKQETHCCFTDAITKNGSIFPGLRKTAV